MKNSKFSLVLILTLVMSLFLAACGGSDKSEGDGGKDKDGKGKADVAQEIDVLETAEIPTMDSVLAQGTTSFTYLGNVNEGLYRLNQEGNPEAALVEGEPEINEDSTHFVFKLKETKWSNGDPVTAHDFVFAWQRAVDPKTASEYGPYMMNGKIKGAQEIQDAASAKKDYDLNTLGVKAKDDYTLEVTLEKPVVYWQDLFAFPTFYPLNKKFVEEKGKDYASNYENILYNGPFVMTKWDGPTATDWVLEKNKEYWDADTVKLEKITTNVVKDPNAQVNAFEGGQADITGLLSTDIVPSYQGDERLVTSLEPTLFYVKMNQKSEALKNVNIRKAISMAFNKEDLAASILNNGSIAADFLVPKEFVNLDGTDFREKNGNLLSYNLEEAKKAWETGLKEIGKDKLELRLLGGDTETTKKIDEYLKNQLETNLPGLTIKQENVPFAVRIERDNSGDYDLLDTGWGPDYGNAMSFMDLWLTGGSNNRMAYSNKQYDKLVKDALVEPDPAKNFDLLQEAERILLEEDYAIAPMYQRAANILVNPAVKGLVSYNYGPDYGYKWITVEAE